MDLPSGGRRREVLAGRGRGRHERRYKFKQSVKHVFQQFGWAVRPLEPGPSREARLVHAFFSGQAAEAEAPACSQIMLGVGSVQKVGVVVVVVVVVTT